MIQLKMEKLFYTILMSSMQSQKSLLTGGREIKARQGVRVEPGVGVVHYESRDLWRYTTSRKRRQGN
jgi:hypothetical protein